MGNTSSCKEHILKNAKFANNLISFIVDEAHSISEWCTPELRPEWGLLSKLIAQLSSGVPTMAASATLPPSVKIYIGSPFGFPPTISTIAVPNNKLNVSLSVCIMKHTQGTLAHLLSLFSSDLAHRSSPLEWQ